MDKAGIVIVTYNRLEKLKKAILACETQTVPPAYIIVVDNASTDGTAAYLEYWRTQPREQKASEDLDPPEEQRQPEKPEQQEQPEDLPDLKGIRRYILTLAKNTGGSGGFYEGLRAAQEQDAEWIFVADDDAYPEKDVLEKLLLFADTCKKREPERKSTESGTVNERQGAVHEKQKAVHGTPGAVHGTPGSGNRLPAALCSSVFCRGRYDTWHRRRLIRRFPFFLKEERIPEQEYRSAFFDLDIYSYVGCMISRTALKRAGLPCKDYFISYDDSEHSLRIKKEGRIVCIPGAIVIHDTEDGTGAKTANSTEIANSAKTGNNVSERPKETLSWKKYYTIRNKLLTYKKHFPGCYFWILCLYYGCRYLVAARAGKAGRPLAAAAIWDAIRGRTGLHGRYRPGWRIHDENPAAKHPVPGGRDL